MLAGRVAEIRRYPVKSMQGERLDDAALDAAGIEGDRRCALIDVATNRVASAKLPHRWRRLLEMQGVWRNGRPAIGLPDGRWLSVEDENADAVLSDLLGRQIRLSRTRPDGLEIERAVPDQVAARGSDVAVEADVLPLGMALSHDGFADFAPVHIVTTASLAELGAHGADIARFRPNLVIDTPTLAGFVENDWIGRELRIGAQAMLEIVLPTPRCAVPTLAQPGLGAAPRLVQALGRMNRQPVLDMGDLPCLGAYARVTRPGRVRRGDVVQCSRA